jgi:hypothetical protein
MIYKINKERWCSKNATPHDPTTRTSGKETRRTPNKNITGRKAEDFSESGGSRAKAMIFHQASASSHTSKERFLIAKTVKLTLFTLKSGPMDFGFWGVLKRRLQKRQVKTLACLKRALKDEWCKLYQETLTIYKTL